MKVFASRYLESPTFVEVESASDWSWQPQNREIYGIFASGRSTNTKNSTYANERDNRSDTDRPNEGSKYLIN